MDVPSEIDILKLVCERLDKAKISYMLTGSFASNFYATPRMTRDIDIVIELNRPDSSKLVSLFQGDFYIEPTAIESAIKHEGMFNIINNSSIYKVDFIIRKNLEYRKTEFERRKKVNISNAPIWIVSPEDLIISKLHWAKDSLSEMQIKDINNLTQSVKDLDTHYLKTWIQKLGLKEIYSKVNAL